MTVKLIFVNSSLPGRFIIGFPLLFVPVAFGLYGLAWMVIQDAELAFVVIMFSFWPILVAGAAKFHGFHLPMSDERAMYIANYLLLFYYFWISCSYIVFLRYALF